ncbi:MAG: Rieske 2Fe-2S domain-containing protein [Candidatus Thermoplasmatota archaeon]|nr:Rieske 2Fe-2S domain-containing protein [Candidatus Thermoplasmatota archaeon]
MPEDEIQDKSRRTFLKAMIVLSAGAAVAGVLKEGISNLVTPSVGLKSFPSLLIVGTDGKPIIADDIPVSTSIPFLFDYPLADDPNFLLNLGKAIPSTKVSIPATGGTYQSPAGVGPTNNIVAFSAICQHLGCTPPEIHFYPPGTQVIGTSFNGSTNPGYIHCSCHGSTYDPNAGAGVITGPTIHPLPPIILTYNSDKTLTAIGMTPGSPTIYGRVSDLSGGNPLSGSTTEVSYLTG